MRKLITLAVIMKNISMQPLPQEFYLSSHWLAERSHKRDLNMSLVKGTKLMKLALNLSMTRSFQERKAVGLQEMHDLVGLLLLIRINNAHQLIMNKRRVPCLDTYLDRVNLVLWPRLKVPSRSSRTLQWYCKLSFDTFIADHVCELLNGD